NWILARKGRSFRHLESGQICFSGEHETLNKKDARPTHYDMLGVEPDATAEEIAKAFAREIGMFRVRPVGGLAEVGVAYETLRDPERRRAYDVAMGFAPEPSKPAVTPEWAPFLMRASAHPVERGAVDPLHRAARRAEPKAQIRPEPVDPRLAAIAASVRELARPTAF